MKKIYAGESTICGNGLHVRESVRKGERICYIEGDKIIKINQNEADALSNPNWIGYSKHIWIDPGYPYKYLNHSCLPNTGIKGAVTLYAIRDISPDEELTIDYSIIEGDPRWVLDPCLCKQAICRKLIRSVQFLDKGIFNSYLPYVPTYFKRLYYSSMLS